MHVMINNHPRLYPGTLLHRNVTSPGILTELPNILLFNNARSALFHGVSALLQKRKNIILVPSYNCGEEIEAIVRTGCEPEFYRVDNSCRIDLNDLESRISNRVLAVHITHYNGFPQPVKQITDICRRHGVKLIEDCAHVLVTESVEGQLGSFGDIAIFSPRKFLPIRNGGLLAINDDFTVEKLNVKLEGGSGIVSDLKYLLRSWVYDYFIGNYSTALECIAGGDNDDCEGTVKIHDFRVESYENAISPLSYYFMKKLDIEDIVNARRRNYSHLFRAFSDIEGPRSLQNILTFGVCPLFYLVEVLDPWKLGRYLLDKSIASTVFWSYFHKDFPFVEHEDSAHLKRHVVALPIHQDLTVKDMSFIAAKVKEFMLR